MAHYRPYTIKPSAGGALINVASSENVGEANYIQKVNFRRVIDREVRREGWTYFNPNNLPTSPNIPVSALNTITKVTYTTLDTPPEGWQPPPMPPGVGERITAIVQAVRANGDRTLFAATDNRIFRYESGTWSEVGVGYGNYGGNRWEVVAVNGEVVFNNGFDLPFTISVEHPTPRPIWELRERGVARVGTICEYYGFLHCFDITEIKADQLNSWMSDPGLAYAYVPDHLCNRIRQRHIWSEYGQPRNWAPIFTATLTEPTSIIQLPFPCSVFVANETKVAVIGGGVNGGTLGGGTGIEDGVLVTAVSDGQISLAQATAAGITYPRTVKVTRFADVSTIVGYRDMTDDGSAITKALALRDVLVVYRDTGIFVGRYTAQLEEPFLFKRVYNGLNVPYFPGSVIEVQGVGHLYASKQRFFLFDGIDEPKIFQVLDLAREKFFAEATNRYSAFAVQQPETREIWFCTPSYTLAYDYEGKTASEIDTGITAASLIVEPGTADSLCFVLANVVTKTVTAMAPPRLSVTTTYSVLAKFGGTFHRYGKGVYACLVSGLWALGDEFNEKDIRSYIIQLSSRQPEQNTWAITIGMHTTPDASVAPTPLFSKVATQPDLIEANGNIMIPLFFRGVFFRDTVSVSNTAGDFGVEISSRTIETIGIDTKGIERTRQ